MCIISHTIPPKYFTGERISYPATLVERILYPVTLIASGQSRWRSTNLDKIRGINLSVDKLGALTKTRVETGYNLRTCKRPLLRYAQYTTEDTELGTTARYTVGILYCLHMVYFQPMGTGGVA